MPVWGTGPRRLDGRTNPQINATPTYLLPTQVSSLGLWLDSADLSTFVLSSVSTVLIWRDKSQNGLFFSTQQGLPQFSTNAGVFFSNTRTDLMLSPSTFTTNSGNTTLFAVGNVYAGGNYMIGLGDGTDLSLRFGNGGTNAQDIFVNQIIYFNGSVIPFEPYAPTNGNFVTNGRINQTRTTQISLSSRYANRYYNGTISEVLIYNYALADAERRGIEAYLARKWGVQNALPFQHPGRITRALAGYRLLTYTPVVSNYGLWYDAMDTSTIRDIGGNFPPLLPPNQLGVGQWNDKSGNNRNLSNFFTNPSFFNLLGTNYYPNVNSPGFISGTPNGGYYNLRQNIAPNSYYIGCNISAFFVFSANSINAPNASILGFTSSFNVMPTPTSGNQLIVNSNSTFDFTLNFNGSNIGLSRFGNNSSNNLVSAPYFGSTSLISVFVNGTQNTIGNVLPSTNLIEINGSFVSSSSFYAGNNFNIQWLSLFGIYNTPTSNNVFFNEIAVFFRTLTTAERSAVETQLLRKWGLTANAPVSFINQNPVTSGLFGWYDAYDQTTVLRNSSNNVSMWLDKSGQSNHLSTNLLTFGSNTGSNIYYSSIQISTNQYPSLFFPSTFAFLQNSTIITNESFSTFTMMAVKRGIRTVTPAAQLRTVSLFSTLNTIESGGIIIGADADIVQLTNITNSQLAANYKTFHINTLIGNTFNTTINGISPNSAVTYYNGGSSNVVGGINYNGMFVPSYIRLMASPFSDQTNGDPRTDGGYLGEVLLYDRILNSTELTNVHNYLLNKWGISTLVSNVPVRSGLNLWLDAYDPALVTLSTNTQLVTQWRDKSLCNFHFSNSGTIGNSRMPLYTISPQTGLPALQFSNSAPATTFYTNIYNTNFTYPQTTETTVFVTYSSTSNTGFYGPLFTILSNNEVFYNFGNGFQLAVANGDGSIGVVRSTISLYTGALANTHNRPTLATVVFNSSFSTSLIVDIPQNTYGIGRNGVVGFVQPSSLISSIPGSLFFSSTTFNVNQATIGTRGATAVGDAQWYFSGYIHEVLQYNRTLSFIERQQVESYLMSKWNI